MNVECVSFIDNSNRIIWLGNVKPTKNRANPNQGRVYDTNGCAPAINTCGGGNLEPFIVEQTCVNQYYKKTNVNQLVLRNGSDCQ